MVTTGSMKQVFAAAVATVLVLGALPAAGAPAACPAKVARENGWSTITVSSFPPPDPGGKDTQQIWRFTADPVTGALYVANNADVMRSTDGGCTWKPVLHRPYFPMSGETHAETAAAFNSMEARGGHVYAVYGSAAGVITVVSSADGGDTWKTSRIDGVSVGQFVTLHVSEHDPKVAYVSGEASAAFAEVPRLFVTRDAGGSWEELPGAREFVVEQWRGRIGVGSTPPTPSYSALEVQSDPRDGKRLWMWSAVGGVATVPLATSSDGGRTWSVVSVPTESGIFAEPYDVHVAYPGSATTAEIAVFGDPSAADAHSSFLSADGGASWIDVSMEPPTDFQYNSYSNRDAFAFVRGKKLVFLFFDQFYRMEPRSRTWVPLGPTHVRSPFGMEDFGVASGKIYAVLNGGDVMSVEVFEGKF